MKTTGTKSFSRFEIQDMIAGAILDACKGTVLPTPDHQRRTIRALLRIAAGLVIRLGGPGDVFMAMAQEAFVAEAEGFKSESANEIKTHTKFVASA